MSQNRNSPGKTYRSFSRRTFLRGVGVTMALPWLESMRVWGDENDTSKKSSAAPVRMAVLYLLAGGVEMD